MQDSPEVAAARGLDPKQWRPHLLWHCCGWHDGRTTPSHARLKHRRV